MAVSTQSKQKAFLGLASDNRRTIEPFLGFELLLFRRFQQQPGLWYEWRTNLSRKASHGNVKDLEAACQSGDSSLQTLESLEELGVGDIHQDLWFLSVMVHRRPKNLLEFVEMEIERERCKRLPKYGDNNLLDALPGFLSTMPKLETVHRHGNHNYFKSTFMWYHTDVNLRIIPFFSEAQSYSQYESLQFWAAKGIIGQKQNFFQDENVVPVLKDFISDIYSLFNICHNCSTACLSHRNGYKVITFKNPYLGNTCVPFQHWACSMECARAVEIPARLEQISAARELDLQYENYVRECVRKFSTCRTPRSMLSVAVSSRSGDSSDDSRRGKGAMSGSSSDGDDQSFLHFKMYEGHGDKALSRRYRSRRWRNGRSGRGDQLAPADAARTKCSCVIS
ncbi:leucine-rich repeat-containing protein 8A [Elysia marginata]|uniref:Leucine-rich repeat-containing protein 8A n=1 Tax=Elysia marginata TaxID=1093978 RepID=A0AAV4JE58_9GAST|nr:leucine-rich repeat-containing protein 8A [Elysia marginata]